MQFVTIIRYTFYSNSMFCSVNDGDLSVKGGEVYWVNCLNWLIG